ncbi:hypothetical protein [Novosphingobium sp.]|uniref:hypothetical protein n=1 Tax=Novosphingobium sp. TaxID=1874826 RepID=UPI003D0BC7A3
MGWIRNLVVWLGAALLASLICTYSWSQMFEGWGTPRGRPNIVGTPLHAESAMWIGIGITSLLFTTIGSLVLSYLFWCLNNISYQARYFIIIGVGLTFGCMWMIAMGALQSPVAIGAGAIYGLCTGCFWVGLHQAMRRLG